MCRIQHLDDSTNSCQRVQDRASILCSKEANNCTASYKDSECSSDKGNKVRTCPTGYVGCCHQGVSEEVVFYYSEKTSKKTLCRGDGKKWLDP